MKYILLIMTVLLLKSFWSSFKSVFTTVDYDTYKLNNTMSKISSDNEGIFDGLMILLMLLYLVYLTIYYILIGIYLKEFVFIVISCLLIIRAGKNYTKSIKWLGNKEDLSVFKKNILSRLTNLASLAYVGYFVYILITTW